MSQVTQYTLIGALHEGIETIVHRARTSDGRRVVIKIGREPVTPRVLATLRNEHALLQGLAIPGVIRAEALAPIAGTLALVLEDFAGLPLHELAQAGRLDLTAVIHIGVALADTLAALHRLPLLHKDIKPHNVLYDPTTGEVKLIDFSIATRLSQEPQRAGPAGAIEGTLAYMSPEQTGRMNRALDQRSDLYSLGATLYELLTGAPPFVGDDPMEMIRSHLARQPTPPIERAPGLPRVVSDIVLKLLAKQAEERYQTAAGLRADLARCLEALRGGGEPAEFPLASADGSGALRLSQRLYGREAEVNELLAAFDRVGRGAVELLLVRGYSGAGKSSLVHEVQRPIARRGGLFVAGKFDQYDRAVPYAPIVEALRGLCRQLLATPAATLGRWRGELQAALGANARLVTDLVPELGLILGPQPALPALGPGESQNRFNLVFTALLRVFAGAEHPLVFFIDDLQWADPASLKLLQSILADLELGHLLLVGAYRDNEVEPGHPLLAALAELRRAGAGVQELRLQPLDLDDITALLADSLGGAPGSLSELAQVVGDKTHGNPFFIGQFLHLLVDDGLLRWEPGAGWQWSAAQLRARAVTDNVVDLMAAKIRRLSPPAQRLLQLAACIGHRFDWSTLRAIAGRPAGETSAALWEALHEGLISPLDAEYRFVPAGGDAVAGEVGGDSRFTFLHDRVQQAADSLVPAGERAGLHLRVARELQGSDPAAVIDARVFEVVNHLNLAGDLVTPAEREARARLNHRAGRRAKAATAYAAARHYLRAGVDDLPADAWDRDYPLCFALHLELAECAHLSGDFAEAEAVFAVALERAVDRQGRAEVHERQLLLHTTRGDFDAVFAAGAAGLALFGVDLPGDEAGLGAALGAGFAAVGQALAGRSPAELLAAEPSRDPDATMIVRLLASMSGPAFVARPHLFALIVLHMVERSLRHGHLVGSDYAYTVYGLMLAGARDMLPEAYAFGELGVQLNERLADPRTRCMVHFLFGGNIIFYRRPAHEAAPYLDSARRSALEVGDFAYLSFYCIQAASLAAIVGDELSLGFARLDDLAGLVRRTRDRASGAVVELVRQVLHNLAGDATSSALAEAGFDEPRFVADTAPIGLVQWIYAVCKLRLAYLHGELELALQMADRARELQRAGAGAGHFYCPEQALYTGLVAASLARRGDPEKALRARLELAREQLRPWSHSNPHSYAAMQHMLDAEAARLDGYAVVAVGLYDAACEAAARAGSTPVLAVACELAAAAMRMRGRPVQARAYLQEAHAAWLRWGARSQAQRLARLEVGLLGRPAPQPHVTAPQGATRRLSDGLLDLDGVLASAQALAGEIHVDRVLDRMMRVVMLHSGAQRGFLLVPDGPVWSIAAEMRTDPDEVRVGLARPLDERAGLAGSVVAYVTRSREGLVVGDARSDPRFAGDADIVARQPRSILCLALIYQTRLSGLLYIENNSVCDAFTPERIELLQLFSVQAAIALENARLYADVQDARARLERANAALEREVGDRTGELSAANAALQANNLRLQQEMGERLEAERARAAIAGDLLRAQEERLAELSAPLIPIGERVVVMPLLGTMDRARAQQVLETALTGALAARAELVILDVTGLRHADERVAAALVETAGALRLLGAQAVLTGVRPDMAEALAEHGEGLQGLRTLGSLQAGIEYALTRTRGRPARR